MVKISIYFKTSSYTKQMHQTLISKCCMYLWNTLFGIFGKCWVCPTTLDQFPLTSFTGLDKGRKPNLCGSVLSLLLFSVFGWNVTVALSMTNFQTNKFCGIRLGVWSLFHVKNLIFLEGFLSHMLRD